MKGEILNERPMATETNQLHKYMILKWALHNYFPFFSTSDFTKVHQKNKLNVRKPACKPGLRTFPIASVMHVVNKSHLKINHAHQSKRKDNNRGRTGSDLHNPALTTPAAPVKNQKDLTCTALSHGSCSWCDTITPKDTVFKIPLLSGKCILLLSLYT